MVEQNHAHGAMHIAVDTDAPMPTRTVVTPHIGDTVYRPRSDPEAARPGIVTSIGPGGRYVTVRWLSAESITGDSVSERTDSLCLLAPRHAELTADDTPRFTIVRRTVCRSDGAQSVETTGLRVHSVAYAQTALAAIATAKNAVSPFWTRDYLGPAPYRLCIDWELHEEFYEVHQIDQQ